MPHPIAAIATTLGRNGSPLIVGNTIVSNLLRGTKMTKAFALFYLATFLASRATAFSSRSTVSTLGTSKLVARPTTPLFMSDDEVRWDLSCRR